MPGDYEHAPLNLIITGAATITYGSNLSLLLCELDQILMHERAPSLPLTLSTMLLSVLGRITRLIIGLAHRAREQSSWRVTNLAGLISLQVKLSLRLEGALDLSTKEVEERIRFIMSKRLLTFCGAH